MASVVLGQFSQGQSLALPTFRRISAMMIVAKTWPMRLYGVLLKSGPGSCKALQLLCRCGWLVLASTTMPHSLTLAERRQTPRWCIARFHSPRSVAALAWMHGVTLWGRRMALFFNLSLPIITAPSPALTLLDGAE